MGEYYDYDLIVTDCNFKYASGIITAYGTYLKEAIDSYIAILKFIKEEGIDDTKITEEIEKIINATSDIPNQIESIAKDMSSQIDTFLSEIDTADDFLY